MNARLEHANLCVADIATILRFVQTAFPDFRIRHDTTDPAGTRWVHVGTDESYLALNQSTKSPATPWQPYEGWPGLNHLGFEVDDVDALRARMLAAGYTESTVSNAHPHRKRIYFHDPEGNDWEFVQYLTDDPALAHDYDMSN